MNMQRRKRIEKVGKNLEEHLEEITAIQEEEQDAFDNLTESIQDSWRGQVMENAVDCLESVVSNIEEAIECLSQAME